MFYRITMILDLAPICPHVDGQPRGSGGAFGEHAVAARAAVEVDPLGLLELFSSHGRHRGRLGEVGSALARDREKRDAAEQHALHGNLRAFQ